MNEWNSPGWADTATPEEIKAANQRLIVRAEIAERQNAELRSENLRLVKKCNRLGSQVKRLHWISAKVFAESHEREPSLFSEAALGHQESLARNQRHQGPSMEDGSKITPGKTP